MLVQRGNTLEYVGVSAIYTGKSKEFIYPDLMMRLRPNQEVTSFFLWLSLSVESARQFMRDRATGTAGNMPKINQETLMSVPLRLPSIDEQNAIEVAVKAALKVYDHSLLQVVSSANQLRRMSDAILVRAFQGELTSQDFADEPASAMLERLKSSNRMEQTKKAISKKRKAEKEGQPLSA